MKTVLVVLCTWASCGAVAAVMNFGPALLRVVAFGPISLLHALA